MSGLSVFPSVFPIFASEPRVKETGYRSRYSNLGSYGEVYPGSRKYHTYSFSPLTFVCRKDAQQDFVALLCSGTQTQVVQANFLDRTLDPSGTVTAQFEGRVSYTCAGDTFTRSEIVYYETRSLSEVGQTGEIGVLVMGQSSGSVYEDNDLISVSVDDLRTGGVTEESNFVSVSINGAIGGLVSEETLDLIAVSVNGLASSTVIEGN